MEDENLNDGANISNEQEEEVLETSNESGNKEEEVDVEDLKVRLQKAEELANNQKIRAEKAEGKLKTVKPEAQISKSSSDLGSKDLYALMEAKVPQDDIDEVVEYAKFKKISVSEALKTSFVKTTLSEKAEQRRIADSTNTGNTRRNSAKVSIDTIISKASAGEMPESDEDMMALIKARKGIK